MKPLSFHVISYLTFISLKKIKCPLLRSAHRSDINLGCQVSEINSGGESGIDGTHPRVLILLNKRHQAFGLFCVAILSRI